MNSAPQIDVVINDTDKTFGLPGTEPQQNPGEIQTNPNSFPNQPKQKTQTRLLYLRLFK